MRWLFTRNAGSVRFTSLAILICALNRNVPCYMQIGDRMCEYRLERVTFELERVIFGVGYSITNLAYLTLEF